MSQIDKLRSLFGWTASPQQEFARFKMMAGALPPLPADSPNSARLVELLQKNAADVTWGDIQAGRIALIEVTPLEMLQAQFGSLADEYETTTGGKPFTNGAFAKSTNHS